MSPDQTPAADSAAPAPADRSEPAQGPPSLGSLAEAFRNAPEALKDRIAGAPAPSVGDNAGGGTAGPEGPRDAAPEESAGAGAPASKPGDAPPPGPSRRGAAAKISEQQSEIDRLVAEKEAERARAAEVESRVRAQDEARESARRAALARIGDDQEFATLSAKRMRGEVLAYEDDEKLTSMLAWREHAADLWEMTDRAHKTLLARAVADRVERYGLDTQTAYDAPLPELLDHTVSVTETRVRQEQGTTIQAQANTIKELQAELRGLRTRGAARTAPTVGGSSDPGPAVLPDAASPTDWFAAGIRARSGPEPARNGRR